MINFYKNRYIYFSISIAFIIIGIVFLFINGVSLDISFKGGAILTYTYDGSIDTDDAAKIISDKMGRNATVQITSDLSSNEKKMIVNMAGNEGLSVSEQTKLDSVLSENFKANNPKLLSSNTVEPFIGKRFLRNGILAILISSVLIVFYVWYRFITISGLSAGVMALVALLHDCIMVFFTFVIFKIPLNDSFVAVILTIVGYSVNDTIIVYDRIRENKKLDGGESIDVLVNKSITQTMSRSINTGATTLTGALIIFIFAYINNIESIVSFALPMAVGLVFGCYSSICIAGTLWTMWQMRKKNRTLSAKGKAARA